MLGLGFSLTDVSTVLATRAGGALVAPALGASLSKLGVLFNAAVTGDGALSNDRASEATYKDHERVLKISRSNQLIVQGAREIEPLLINSDDPVTTTILLPAGDYILSASGTGSVTTTGQSTINPAGDRRQVAFTLTSATSTTFTPAGITNWMLEETSGQTLQVASEYTPLNVDQSNGLAFAVGSPDGSPVTITANITVSSGTPTWEVDSGEQFNVVDLTHTFYNKINAFRILPGSESTITRVRVNSLGLIGALPDVSSLVNLERFFFYSNNLVGSMPDISSNDSITHVRAYINNLSGPVPAFSALNSTVTNYWAYSNNLSGTFPSLDFLTSLLDIRIDRNNFSGTFPSIANNTSLFRLLAYSNDFYGSLPNFDNNTILEYIRLNSNNFTGTIPSITNLSSLQEIRLDSNSLTDYTASTISSSLTLFNASNNNLIETAINQILIDCDTSGPAVATLNIGGTGNAAPTGAGLTAKTSLQGKGWAVTTN